jgi:hypothetical protein
MEFTCDLNAREVRPDNDEMKERAMSLRIFRSVSCFQHGDRAVPQCDGIRETLHFKAVSPQSRHIGETRDAAQRQDQMVIAHDLWLIGHRGPERYFTPIEVDIADLCHAETRCAQKRPDGYDHVPGLKTARPSLNKQRIEQ